MSIGMSINAIAYWAVFVLPLPLAFSFFYTRWFKYDRDKL